MTPQTIGFAAFTLAAIIGAGVWIFSPFQDRTSNAYQLWKLDREQRARRQREMIEQITNSTFQLDDLELILVAPGKTYFSWWGHLLVRLRGSGASPPADVVVSFLADFADFPVDRWKASFGGYDILPRLITYEEAETEYVRGENRSFTCFSLETNAEQRKRFLEVLCRWATSPTTAGTYRFFSHNCVGLVSHILQDAQVLPKQTGRFAIFPSKFITALLRVGVLRDTP